MKVALYARVSSDEQREKETVQNQLEFLRKHVNLYQLQVYKEYIDDGVTGKIPLHDRPYGRDLLHDAREKRFNVVLFYKLDRFSRKLRHLLDTYDTLESYDVNIISATEHLDTSTASRRFTMQILGAAAELERESILERTSQGRDRARRNGKAHGGALPFGYTVSEDHKIILGSDSSIAKEIFHRVANGETLSEVCQWLNASGTSAGWRYRRAKHKPASTWAPSRISKMLRNPVYLGKDSFKAKSGEIVNDAPALIDEVLY